jgi:hypothetical protein
MRPTIKITIALFLVSTACTAQSFYNNSASTPSQPSPPPSGKSMSPEEYRSMMKNLQKQEAPAPTPAPVVSTPAPAVSTPVVNTPEVSSTPPVSTPAQPATTSAPQAQPATPPPMPQPTQNVQTAPAAAKQEESQSYTGFVPPNKENNQNTNSSTDKPSGWNIKY